MERKELAKVVGARMKAAALELGLDAGAMAERLGVSKPTIYSWWNGTRMPDLLDLSRYAEQVGKQPGWFFDPEGQNAVKVEDATIRVLRLAMEGLNLGQALGLVLPGGGRLSPRERAMTDSGTEALRERIAAAAGGAWEGLAEEERLQVLRLVTRQATAEA